MVPHERRSGAAPGALAFLDFFAIRTPIPPRVFAIGYKVRV
jgi:hypothetical protein